MGLTKRFITEMFGSTGDRENKSLVRGMAKFLRWGAVSISLLFVMGYMGYEVAMTSGLIVGGEDSSAPQGAAVQPNVNELLAKHGEKLDRAMANGSIDRVLSERGVPAKMREKIKEQIRQRNQTSAK